MCARRRGQVGPSSLAPRQCLLSSDSCCGSSGRGAVGRTRSARREDARLGPIAKIRTRRSSPRRMGRAPGIRRPPPNPHVGRLEQVYSRLSNNIPSMPSYDGRVEPRPKSEVCDRPSDDAYEQDLVEHPCCQLRIAGADSVIGVKGKRRTLRARARSRRCGRLPGPCCAAYERQPILERLKRLSSPRSVEPSSTTMMSSAGCVCARALSTASPM